MNNHFTLNFTPMNTTLGFRISIMLVFLLFAPVTTQAQTDKKADELKKLEAGVTSAKGKVAKNERQMAIADSLITVGTKMIAESKTESKAIESERKKLDKDKVTKQKSLTRLSTSKDKEEASKAKADLKALDAQYKLDSKALSARSKDATKKLTTGNANLSKGKASKKSAHDALKVSQAALNAAQAKYDAASGENVNSKNKKKK